MITGRVVNTCGISWDLGFTFEKPTADLVDSVDCMEKIGFIT
jgi:hypothetical protein